MAWLRLFGLLLAVGIYRWFSLLDNPADWDEANILAISRLPLLEMVRVLSIRDFHPPGFHLLIHFWTLGFGESDLSLKIFAWLAGLSGVGATWLLARRLTDSGRVALLAAAFVGLSPFMMKYGRLATHYGLFYAMGLFSWWLFLRVLAVAPQGFRRAWEVPVYLGVTVLAIHLHAAGVILLLSQVGYFWLGGFRHSRRVAALLAMVALTFLPYFWLTLQPWHASRLPELRMNHHLIPWPFLVLAPADLVLLGHDQQLPRYWEWALLLGLPLAFLLWKAWRRFVREHSADVRNQLLWIGVWPGVTLYGLSVALDTPVFQFRTVIAAVFAFSLLLALWLDSVVRSRGQRVAALAAAALLLTQGLSWQARREQLADPTYAVMATLLRQHRKPGDGVVVIPGYHHLGIMKQYDPENFGLTVKERRFDPARENLFNMVQRWDQEYLFLSATDLLETPGRLNPFVQFQQQHQRIWLFSNPGLVRHLLPLLRCGTEVVLQGPDGEYWRVKCPPDHPRHCRRLLGAENRDWICPNGEKGIK